METQDLNNLPATKGDIQMLLEAIRRQNDYGIDTPENPVFFSLWKRLDQIEKATRKATALGLADIPIDVETAAAITGLAEGTLRNYASYEHIDTIRIGAKVQFSLKGCIKIIEKGFKKAAIDCTSDITGYHRKKRKRKGKASTTARLIVAP